MVQTSQNGITSEKMGSWRPTMALRASTGSPVTAASVMSGVPRAPKATGAVFPMSESPAAGSGLKPMPISMAAEIATGALKPAAPSMNAPKLKATRIAWILRSLAMPVMDVLIRSNLPVWTVTS